MTPRWLYFRLGLLMFLQLSIPGAWFPLFSVYLENLNFSPTAIAWCSSTSALAAIFSPLIWGQIADRWFAAERCISLCAFVSGAALWLLARQSTPWPVFLCALGFWFFMIPVFTLVVALTFRHLSDPEKQYGPVRMWGTVGWVAAGGFLSLWLAKPACLVDFFGLVYPNPLETRLSDSLILGVVLSFALGCYAWTLPSTPPSPARQVVVRNRRHRFLLALDAPLAALGLFRNRIFTIICVCLFGLYVTMPFSQQMTPLLLKQRGVSQTWLPVVLTIAQSTEVVTLALLPFILLRLEEKGTLLLGISAWTGALVVLALGEPLSLVIASLALHGLYVCCFLVAGQVVVNRRASRDIRASTQALLQVINGLGLFLGHQLVGWLRGASGGAVGPAFTTAAILSALLVVTFVLGFQARSDQLPPAP